MRDKNINGVAVLKELIKKGTALYYYRATPFTEHGEFNYDGNLKEDFFFENMFSPIGNCSNYVKEVKDSLQDRTHKSILLLGNQGCGKTTFMHHLTRECNEFDFIFFDFDKDTSNPTIGEYIEKLSTHLHDLIKSDNQVNKLFYDLYIRNKELINKKINGNNNINNFFDDFHKTFIISRFRSKEKEREDFIKKINELFFNQLLSLITLWYICKLKNSQQVNSKPLIFCFDNLDVLVNKEIIEKFFKEYLIFVRNVDSIIQNINDDFVNDNKLTYKKLFSFIFCCRKHTWARVRQHYRHDQSFMRISTLERDITDAFEKRAILAKREKYINDNKDYYGDFIEEVSKTKAIISDLDMDEDYSHNIYDLFDDDYRQCNITFEEILAKNPSSIEEYFNIKNKIEGKAPYGARGLIYKELFEKFKEEDIFKRIGVLETDRKEPLVSNARLLLNYLNFHTYTKDRRTQKHVAFDKIVNDFEGIISKDDIDKSLIAMFKLGDDSCWNELIAFNEIHNEELETCSGLEVFITKAGHEYLSLMATHFEFFNIRVTKEKIANIALFSRSSIEESEDAKCKYNFDETITNVIEVVEKCCENMSMHYKKYMESKYKSVSEYLGSHFVYGSVKVLHGERIIHTHIRYIDSYRLYILKNTSQSLDKKEINKKLVEYIERYIIIGKTNPLILTTKSTEKLFPAFEKKIKLIRDSDFEDFTTKIDI